MQYDHWSKQWLPPHITIVAPFSSDLSEAAIQAIESMEVNIPVKLQGWGAFTHERSNVLWLETGEQGTKDVRAKLARQIPEIVAAEMRPPVDWTAPASHHVTVANRIPHEEFAKLQAELKKIDISGEFTIPHLRVFVWDVLTGRWLFARAEHLKK